MKIMKKTVCMMLLSTIIILGTDVVWAKSILTSWQFASTHSETMGNQCPLQVETEQLVFDISDFPEGESQRSDSSATIVYTVHNPTENAIQANLFYPLGMAWEYELYGFGETEEYGVFVNGSPVKSLPRYFYVHEGKDFEQETDLPKLIEGFDTNSFFKPDMTVTEYIYEISNVDSETYDAASAGFVLHCDSSKTRVYFKEYYDVDYDEASRACPRVWAKDNTQLHLYIIGEPLSQNPLWHVYENGAMEKEISGKVTLIETNQLTFLEYVTKNWDPKGNIIKSDWYNAMVHILDSCTLQGGFIGELYTTEDNLANSLMMGLEYEINVEANQTVINEVTIPVIPSIRDDYEPLAYEYIFAFSSTKGWGQVDELEVIVNTPFYMIKSASSSFEQTDQGYMAQLSNIPKKEVHFILSDTEEASSDQENLRESRTRSRLLRFGALGIGILVLFLSQRKTKRL
jgi:hypothetical protein